MTDLVDSDPPPPEKKPAAISLSFDYEQLGLQLFWKANTGHRNLYRRRGRGAGSLWLKPGEAVSIHVTGWGDKPGWTFALKECYIITAPKWLWRENSTGAVLSPPSPFSESNGTVSGSAVRTITQEQFGIPTISPKKKYYRTQYRATDVLTVIGGENQGAGPQIDSSEEYTQIGRWEMFFMVNVVITPGPGINSIHRIFQFDPETEVGNGL